MNTSIGSVRGDLRRLFPVTAFATALAMMASGPSWAADAPARRSPADIQADIERLKQQLEQDQQDLAAAAADAPAQPEQAAAPAPADGAAPPAADGTATLKKVAVRAKRVSLLGAQKDKPQASSVVGGDELKRLGATNLRDVTRRVASLTKQNSSNARSMDLALRGLNRKGNTEAQDPGVGITIDGVSYAYSGLANGDFTDIDKVELLRGPQGNLGGHNWSLGALNISTARPLFTRTTDFLVQAGQNDALFASAATGGPVVDNLLAWRGSFYLDKSQGEYRNAYVKDRDQTFTDRSKLTGKVQFLLTPSDTLSARLILELQPRAAENDNGLYFFHAPFATYADDGKPTNLANDASTRLARRWFGQETNYNYQSNYINFRSGLQNQDNAIPLVTGTRGYTASVDWSLGSGYSLTSISAFRFLYFDARNDEGTPFDISTQGGGGVRYTQRSQELRFSLAPGGFVDWTAGLYYLHSANDVDSKSGWGSDAGAWFANAAQYKALDVPGAGQSLLLNSLDRLRVLGVTHIRNDSPAVFGQFNWHFLDDKSLTLITGGRITQENRRNNAFANIVDNGYAPELNASISSFGVPLGGFDSYFNSKAVPTDGSTANDVWVRDGFVVSASTPGAVDVKPQTVALTTDAGSGDRYSQSSTQADYAAKKYFGAASWAALSSAQKQQLAYAQAIRKGQTGLIYNTVVARPFRATQYNWTFGPNYRIDDRFTTYLTWQHGEKAGISQIISGQSRPAKAEKSNTFELGLKSTGLLDNTLSLGADLFLINVRNYQQAVSIVDEFQTAVNGQTTYISTTGNVPKTQAKGLELDALYTGIRYTSVRLAAAYNDDKYKKFPNSPKPAEFDTAVAPAYRDVSGQTLPGASKYSANLGIDVSYPVFNDKRVHSDLNFAWTSRYNSDVTLSQYGWINSYSTVDFGIGFGSQDRGFDVNFIAKNLFNSEGKAYGFSAGTLDTTPRWIGVQFTESFGGHS